MKRKKIIAIVLAVVLVFGLVAFFIFKAVQDDKDKKCDCGCNCEQLEQYLQYFIQTGQLTVYNSQSSDQPIYNLPSDNQQQADQQQNVQQPSNNQQQSNQQQSDDPTKWTTAQIVETYKHSAARTHNSVTSYQQMTLRQLNAPGINSTLLNIASGVMNQALKNNSKNIAGITGGHQNLQVSDVKSARAYKSGNNIVIEMLMKEQTDGAKGNMYSGTVGHAISVVGDIDEVIGQFSALGMDAEIADQDVKLHYSNPMVKVTINSNGVIVNGTWSYVTNISLNNLTIKALGFAAVPVAQSTAIVDFSVVLNGGFKG